MLDRRTYIVLGSLIAGMTVTSALLLALEPGRVAPLSGQSLSSLDERVEPTEALFRVGNMRDWEAIYIYDSLSTEGSAQGLNQLHVQMGLDGLASHFVIGNGRGAPDGLIEVGFRWQRQFTGEFLEGEGADWYNKNAIGICLIGNADRESFTEAQMRELVWLVRQLQSELNIPRERVLVQVGTSEDGLSPRFSYANFEQQLLR